MLDRSKFLREQDYTVAITGRNFEITKPTKEYIAEKIAKIEKISNHVLDLHVKLDIQKLNHTVDIILKFAHTKVKVHASSESMYPAIDKAFDRLYSKLRKWKSRIQDHHAKGHSVVEMEVNILERDEEDLKAIDQEIVEENNRKVEESYKLPKVIKKKKLPLKMLTLDEAVMKMELSDDYFMVFRSEEEQNLKIIYRRKDGSYGVISPE